jgi:hypothetical protein
MKRQLIYHTPISVDKQNYKESGASVLTLAGTNETATIKTISRDGISLNCDQPTLHKLLPNSSSVSVKQPVKLDVSFKLETLLEVSADVICTRRLSKDTFQLELRFSELSPSCEAEIDTYIEQCLYSNGNTKAFAEHSREYSQVA